MRRYYQTVRTSVVSQVAIVLIIAGSFLPVAYRFLRHPRIVDGITLLIAIGLGAQFALRLIPQQVMSIDVLNYCHTLFGSAHSLFRSGLLRPGLARRLTPRTPSQCTTAT